MSNEEKKKRLTEMLDFCHICDDKAELAQDILHEYIASIDEWENELYRLVNERNALVKINQQLQDSLETLRNDNLMFRLYFQS